MPWKQPQRGASVGAGVRGGGSCSSPELRAEGSRQPRAQVVGTISQGAEGKVQTLWQLKVLPSDAEKFGRKICSVRRKGLDKLVIRRHHFSSILPNPLKSLKYLFMGVYLSS